MSNPTATTRSVPRRRAGAFTLVEVLFSVLIIGVLMGLLVVGFRSARTFTSSVGSRTAVANIKGAASKFTSEFGFPPPLVCDQAPSAAAAPSPLPHPARSSVMPVGNDTQRSKMAVYSFSRDPANTDLTVLAPAALTSPTAANPFEDFRYSERTIAYYLVGACNTERNRGEANADAKKVPIDGVFGPGFYTPNLDGTFKVPQDVKSPDHDGALSAKQQTRRQQKFFESFVDLSGKGISLKAAWETGTEPDDGGAGADPSVFRFVTVVDSKGVPIRYYRWLHKEPLTGLQDYRVPPLVGRANTSGGWYGSAIPPDRDLEQNAQLRDATFAIVAAGPDGAFGDEPDADLMRILRKQVAPADIIKLRYEAEKDNIVEVGK